MNNEEQEIEKIAKTLHDFIRQEVHRATEDDCEYKRKYDDLVSQIQFEHQQGKAIYEDYSAQKLSFSTVEAEGYLRAFMTIEHYIKEGE